MYGKKVKTSAQGIIIYLSLNDYDYFMSQRSMPQVQSG